MLKVPQLLLAAGGSSRMGRSKALLPWGAVTLLESRIEVLRQTHQPIVIVLGADEKKIQTQLSLHNVYFVNNPDWKLGMGSSIAKGLDYVKNHFLDADGILISLVDQPLIPLAHYLSILEKFKNERDKIIVSKSSVGWTGVPVLFPSLYFNELSDLESEKSGKDLINKYKQEIIAVPGYHYLVDIDTPEAYQAVLRKYQES